MCALLRVCHFAEQIVLCLELLLDNLGSDDADAASQESGHDASMAARGVAASAPGPDHALQQQQQLVNQPAAAGQVSAPHARRLSAPAAFPAAAMAPAAAGGAALGAVQAAQAVPAPAAAAAAQAAPVAPAGLPLSAHTSPSTPVHTMQAYKQRQGPYDSGGVLSGTGDAVAARSGQSHSGSGPQLRSSTSSGNPLSQIGGGAASAKLPSVLDENVYLQDL
jgi:hypothetical protein